MNRLLFSVFVPRYGPISNTIRVQSLQPCSSIFLRPYSSLIPTTCTISHSVNSSHSHVSITNLSSSFRHRVFPVDDMRLFPVRRYPEWTILKNGSPVRHQRTNQEERQRLLMSSIWQLKRQLNPFVIHPSKLMTSMQSTLSKKPNKRSPFFREISIGMHPFHWNNSATTTQDCRKRISLVRRLSLRCFSSKMNALSYFILVLVATTAAYGFAVAPLPVNIPVLICVTVGTILTSASANTINQLMEIPYDAQMKRTRNRVLVLGQMRFAISDWGWLSEENPLSLC